MQVTTTKQTASSHTAQLRRGGNSEKIKDRLQRELELFPFLPDDALIDVRLTSAIRGRSVASTWRDVANGQLGPLVRIGARSSRVRVGNVRASLK